jgi:hypothetical protein
MLRPLVLASLLILAPVAPAIAQEDDLGLGDDAPPSMGVDAQQLKNLDLKGMSLKPSGGGITDLASAMKLIAIGKALKAGKKVSPEDIQFLRSYLKKSGGDGGGSHAAMMQKLDQVLDQLQRRTTNPTEEDELMRELGEGADMDDLPKLDD